jgi:hypothetical protein
MCATAADNTSLVQRLQEALGEVSSDLKQEIARVKHQVIAHKQGYEEIGKSLA